jgi:hypothetical protein
MVFLWYCRCQEGIMMHLFLGIDGGGTGLSRGCVPMRQGRILGEGQTPGRANIASDREQGLLPTFWPRPPRLWQTVGSMLTCRN